MSAGPAAITLWNLSLDASAEITARAVALLDAEERAQHRRFASADLARAFALRRAARRLILAHTIGRAPAEVAIETGPHGKPGCAGLAFSAAHSGSRAVVAVAHSGPIGVDIERLRPLELDRMARRILSPREQTILQTVAEADRNAALIRFWTAKEAIVKAEGTGLDLSALPTLDAPALADIWVPVMANSPWQVRTWISEGYAIALAAPGPASLDMRDAGPLLAAMG